MNNKKFTLGIYIANLLGTVVFGGIWLVFNVLLGNLIALKWLGWATHFPAAVQQLLAVAPSTGQLLLEESLEAEQRKKARQKKEKRESEESEVEGLGWSALGVIALCSSTLDLIGPAIGIMVTVAALGGEIGIVPAGVLAMGASWFSQSIAWKCFKRTTAMTFQALQGVLRAPFLTKSSKRRGHSVAFAHALEAPRTEE